MERAPTPPRGPRAAAVQRQYVDLDMRSCVAWKDDGRHAEAAVGMRRHHQCNEPESEEDAALWDLLSSSPLHGGGFAEPPTTAAIAPSATAIQPTATQRDIVSANTSTTTAAFGDGLDHPGQPRYPPEEQARRERNRLKVRRMYYRKLERLAALRTEVADLETHLKMLLLSTRESEHRQLEQHALVPMTPHPPSTDTAAQMALVREKLGRENAYLRRVVFQHTQEILQIHKSAAKLHQLHAGPSSSSNLKIKPLTHQECRDLRQRSLEEVRAFARDKNLFAKIGGVCGWDNMRLVQDGVLKFYVEKRVTHFNADELASLSWSLLRDPERFAQLYSSAVEMKCRVVQCIDADNIVHFHEHRTMDPSKERVTVKTILLLSRFQTVNGYVIVLRGLDHDKMVVEDLSLDELLGKVAWNDLFCWLEYEQDTSSSPSCACSLAGFASTVGSNVYYWMIEIVQVAVRWESMTIGPSRLLFPGG